MSDPSISDIYYKIEMFELPIILKGIQILDISNFRFESRRTEKEEWRKIFCNQKSHYSYDPLYRLRRWRMCSYAILSWLSRFACSHGRMHWEEMSNEGNITYVI